MSSALEHFRPETTHASMVDNSQTRFNVPVALFMVFIVSQIEGFDFSGWTRTITGVVGLLMLISGGIWNIRHQSAAEKSNE